jgi:hypothetical protein
MSGPDPHEMAERHGRVLARLAELNLSAAERLHDRLVAAETNAEARDLGLALQRVSRSLRQTLLLEAKLARDARAAAREDVAEARAGREAEVTARKARVRHEVGRVAMEAGESPEDVETLLSDLDDRLDGYVRAHDFETATLDELVVAVCKDLGFAFDAHDLAAEPAAAAPRAPYEGWVQAPNGGWSPPPDSS